MSNLISRLCDVHRRFHFADGIGISTAVLQISLTRSAPVNRSSPPWLREALSRWKMDKGSSIGSRIRGTASALMTDCFSQVSPTAAMSALASASRSDGKLHSLSTISDSSTLESSSQVYSPRCLDDQNGVHGSAEQGFRTRSSESSCYSWGQQWAFEMFTSEPGARYLSHPLNSTRLLEESMNQVNPEGCAWSAQRASQGLGLNWAHKSSRCFDRGSNSPYERSDGAAVVALLSSPNFAIQTLEDAELNDETDHDQNKCTTPQLKPETNAELGNLASLHPLYLLPSFNREVSDLPERGTSRSVPANVPCNRTPSNPLSASDVVQPWICMNDSYLIDVWDVLGLAKQTVYLKIVIPPNNVEVLGKECSATSRLAMIRKHIDYLDKW